MGCFALSGRESSAPAGSMKNQTSNTHLQQGQAVGQLGRRAQGKGGDRRGRGRRHAKGEGQALGDVARINVDLGRKKEVWEREKTRSAMARPRRRCGSDDIHTRPARGVGQPGREQGCAGGARACGVAPIAPSPHLVSPSLPPTPVLVRVSFHPLPHLALRGLDGDGSRRAGRGAGQDRQDQQQQRGRPHVWGGEKKAQWEHRNTVRSAPREKDN